jgi:hypothetical protein
LVAASYLGLCLVIWEGRISDALLAAKMPVVCAAGLGLGVVATMLSRRGSALKLIAGSLMVVLLSLLVARNRGDVLAITRDPSALQTIDTVAQIAPDGTRGTTVWTLWGHDYWALTYAQAYEGRLTGLRLVDHNADLAAIVARGDRLVTLERTFYQRPIGWWDDRMGRVHLSCAAPGMIEVATAARRAGPRGTDDERDMGNGVRVLGSDLVRQGADGLVLTVHWTARAPLEHDYSVGVHLLAQDPPRGAEDILAQADRSHPVGGWYPTTRWEAGEVVRDCYTLTIPSGVEPVGVRLGMYRQGPQGAFINSEWVFLPLPEEDTGASR